jgi:tripartite-type tricarboxylate transporter receptor subunit TctC
MNILTRVRHSVAGLALLLLAATAQGQAFPAKQIRLISPYAPGGANDIICRILSDRLAEGFGQPVLVDNKPGAGSIVGSTLLVKSPPDGYTIMMADIAHGANPALRKSMPYDTLKDFTPVVLVAELPTVLLVHPSVPAGTVGELVAYAKANPGKLNYSSSGFGSTNHLAAEVFKSELGLDITHVPFQGGGQAMNALLGGQVQILFITLPASLPHLKAGKVKALAVTSASRMSMLPEVPTVAETVIPGLDVNLWIGVVAPAGTPPAVVSRLNAEFNKVLDTPAVRERIVAQGANVAGGTAEQFDAHIRRELQRWARTIKPEMRVD